MLGKIMMFKGAHTLDHVQTIVAILTEQPRYFRDFYMRRQWVGDARIGQNLSKHLNKAFALYSNPYPTDAKFDDHTE